MAGEQTIGCNIPGDVAARTNRRHSAFSEHIKWRAVVGGHRLRLFNMRSAFPSLLLAAPPRSVQHAWWWLCHRSPLSSPSLSYVFLLRSARASSLKLCHHSTWQLLLASLTIYHLPFLPHFRYLFLFPFTPLSPALPLSYKTNSNALVHAHLLAHSFIPRQHARYMLLTSDISISITKTSSNAFSGMARLLLYSHCMPAPGGKRKRNSSWAETLTKHGFFSS